MIQNFIYRTSKFIPILTRKANNLVLNNPLKINLNNNLHKFSLLNFSDKNEKGKKDNKEKGKDQKSEANKKQDQNNKNNNQKSSANKSSEQNKENSKQQKGENQNKEEKEILIDLKQKEKEIDEAKDLTPEEKKELKKLFSILAEKNEDIGDEKFFNFLIDSQKKILDIAEEDPQDVEKDFKSTTISHNYEKEFGAVSKTEKDYIEKITKDFLKDYDIDAKEAEFLKERRRDIVSYALFDRIRDLKSLEAANNYIATYTDFKNYEYTIDRFDNIVQFFREIRDLENPAYVQIRSMDRLVKDDEKIIPKERNIDTRQNANSDDYLKIQPRMKIDYAYNIEQNREFYYNFEKIFQEDQKKLIEKMKLIKYIKTYPNKYGVKNRWIAKHFNVPIEKLPDYDVDISGFKPEPTKKAKRNYQKRMADDISNYEAWRTFDRIPSFYSENDQHYNVELSPNKLNDVKFITK